MALQRLTNYVEQRIEQITALQTITNDFNHKCYNCPDDINASLSCRHAVTCLPCGRDLARCPLCRDKLVSKPKRIVMPETNSAAVVRPYHLPPPGQPQISPIRIAMEYQAWPDVVLPFGIDPADWRLYPSWVSTRRERECYRRTDTFIHHRVNADAPGRLHYQHTGVVTVRDRWVLRQF